MKHQIELPEALDNDQAGELLGHPRPVQPGNHDTLIITEILPTGGWRFLNIQELWQFRELIFHLAWRDVKVRYKQTILGAAWAILQPAMMMVVFTIFFSRMAKLPSGNLPYPLFVLAGILPWSFFATAISQCGNSIVNSEHLITKIYFPRLSVPLASVAAAAVDFLVALTLLAGFMVYYRQQIAVGPGILLAPVVTMFIVLAALGVGTLFAALNVAYRDFRLIIPFVVQLWLFATPSVYMNLIVANSNEKMSDQDTTLQTPQPRDPAASLVSQPSTSENTQDNVRTVSWLPGIFIGLNPMTGLIATFRAAILGGTIPWSQFGVSAACVVLLFLTGTLYFRRVEDTFPDII